VKPGLREHGLALFHTVLAFRTAGAADAGGWQLEPAHSRLLGKIDRYAGIAPPPLTSWGNAARARRPHWQEPCAGHDLDRRFPRLLVAFTPRRARAARPGRASAPGPVHACGQAVPTPPADRGRSGGGGLPGARWVS
jgi:hypothetical protein